MVLTDLPPELLLMISDLLRPADVVCFSLCAHKLLRLLGEKERALLKPKSGVVCFEALKSEREPLVWNEDRELFLTQLSRDQPRYFFCYICTYLHPWDKILPPGPAFRPNPSLRCQKKRRDTLHEAVEAQVASRYDLQYCHVQLAMRRFYCGPEYGITPRSLDYTNVKLWADRPFTSLMSVEARICPNSPSLCMRIQSMAVVRPPYMKLFLAETRWLVVCAHTYTDKPARELPRLVKSLMDTYRRGDDASSHLHRCPECGVDYKLALREYDGKLALVITKWLDFGSGLSPNDPRWNTHYRRSCQGNMPVSASPIGSTRWRFETASGRGSEEDLLNRNISYLSGNRFRVDMDKFNVLMWFLQAETHVPRISVFKSFANYFRSFYDPFVPQHDGQLSAPLPVD